MGFNPPVPQQDSNWEIRAAVMLSLFFQVLLIFLGPIRKRSSSPLFRLTVWSSYLLADWVADLALGLLLNNLGNIGASTTSGSTSSPVIFAFWTPFLLLHLGGPDTITAYSVEDNELWNRHLIGLLFELFSASVIIFCSLRNNPLVPATMLMLMAGVIKYGERTYSLYSGSKESLRDNILGPPEPGPNYARLITEFESKEKAGLVVEINIVNGDAEEAHEEMEKQEMMRLVLDRTKSVEARAYEFFLIFRRLLVDVIISFKERRLSQAFFLRDTEETRRSSDDQHDEKGIVQEAFAVMDVELNFMYDMVYTKAPVAHSMAGWMLRCICSGCLVAALTIFYYLDKPRHQILRVDVGITYALLLGGLSLDAAALVMLFFSNNTRVYLEEHPRWLGWLARLRQFAKRWQTWHWSWSGTISQMNLIRYCQEKPGPYNNKAGGKWLWLKIAKMLGIEEIVDDFFFIRRVRFNRRHSEPELSEFIFRGLKDALHKLKVKQERKQKAAAQKLKIEQETKAPAAAAGTGGTTPAPGEASTKDVSEADTDAMAEKDAIAEVCRLRGDGVVKDHKDDIKRVKGTMDGDARFKVILDSVVKSDFDESLLLWHIATDLCRYRPNETVGDAGETVSVRPVGPLDPNTVKMQAIGETLSEYMLYLLIKQPEMLSATAGIGLRPYRDTCAEVRQFFGSKEACLKISNYEKDYMRMCLLNVHTSSEIRPASFKGDRSKSVLFDAVILAKALRDLDEHRMWELISLVWGEMLSFAAVSGRGSMHVRSLNRGGELITFVWLLMQHMGLSDMYEIQQGDPSVQLIVHY